MPRILGDHWDLGGSLYTINRFSDQYKKGLHYDYAQEKKNEVNLLKSTDSSHENNDRKPLILNVTPEYLKGLHFETSLLVTNWKYLNRFC